MSVEENKSSLFDLVKLKELGGFKAGDLLAVDPELETKFMQYIGRTVKHDKMTSNLVLKTGFSAYTREPLNVFLRGESSIGKTYVVVNGLAVFPKEDVWFLGGLSPTALVHDRGLLVDKNNEPIEYLAKPEKDAMPEDKEAYQKYREKMKTAHYLVDLQGKILVFLEAPNIETFNKLRPVLSHDVWEISYKFTDKTSKGGPLQTMHVIIRGWPATIFCSTSERFVQDLATRSFTFTPETTEAKYKDANILSGSKVAFPWKYEQDLDQGLLQSYVTYFKNHMEKLQCLIPYGEAFGTLFPAKFPRSMRDFKHVLGLIQVSALFHLAQRPLLVRKLKFEIVGKDPAIPEFREDQHVYVIAVKQDYDNVMNLWKEIRETTETSAAGHHLTFFHQIVEPMSKKNARFTLNDLTDSWNAKFSDRKSSDAIRNWVNFLCDIGYMTKEPDPNDKRQNLLKVIEEKINSNSPQNDLTVIFTLETLKEWLNNARQITAENHISLIENLITDAETTLEAIYAKYFYSEVQDSSVIVPSLKESPLAESVQEKTINQKIVQLLLLNSDDVLKLERVTGDFQDTCITCGFKGRMDWQATKHDGSWGLLCGACGDKLAKELRG